MAPDLRLKREKDFDRDFSKGKKLYSSSLTLVYIPSKELKVGFAVGKKHGGSVERYRIKRLLRESFRSFTPQIGQNFFFVFIPKPEKEYTLEKFKESMGYILRKGGFTVDKC